MLGGYPDWGDVPRTSEILEAGDGSGFSFGPEMPGEWDQFFGQCAVPVNSTHVFMGGGARTPRAAYLMETSSGDWTQLSDLGFELGRWYHSCGVAKSSGGDAWKVVMAGGTEDNTNPIDTSVILDSESLNW